MPALKNIKRRIKAEPKWDASYQSNKSSARKMSQEIYLAHGTGRADKITEWPYALDPAFNGKKTRDSETLLSISPSIYFYAGRLWPSVSGGACFAFGNGCEIPHQGAAAPFDTGGVAQKIIKCDLPSKAEAHQDFVKESSVSLNKWRCKFAIFVAAYFDSPGKYWGDVPPCREDPEKIFAYDNDWPSWTWEVRFEEKQSLLKATRWAAQQQIVEHFVSLLNEIIVRQAELLALDKTQVDQGQIDELESRINELEAFLKRELSSGKNRLEGTVGTKEYSEQMENWIMLQCIN